MAVDFDSTHKAKDPLQDVDETVPGFVGDPSVYVEPTPGGKRRARTFSQMIADATRGVDAGMNRYTKPGKDLSSDNYMPDWRGHYEKPDPVPAPRRSLQLQTMPPSEIKPLTVAERVAMGQAGVGKFDPDEARDQAGKWTAAGADEFVAARDRSARAAYLSTHTPEELLGHRLFLGYGGKVGYALDKDGDLQNVFNNGGPKGAGQKALVDAIKHGATTLDAYDPYLPSLYSRFGFVPTGRLAFNDEYAPAGWDYKANGRPDVVLMTWKGGDRDTIENRIGTFPEYKPGGAPLFADYDAAKASQRSAGVDKRSHAGGGADGDSSRPALWRERFSGTLAGPQGAAGSSAEFLKDNPYHLGPGPGGGEFTSAPGGGVAAGDVEAVGQGELKLDHRVIGVGGDEWNQKTAVRLEREYQAAKPKLEKLLTEGMDEKIETKIIVPKDPEKWDDFGSQKQEAIGDDYVSSNWQSEYDYQLNDWQENSAPDLVVEEMADNDAAGDEGRDWLREAIKDHIAEREENGEDRIPYTVDQLDEATILHHDGSVTWNNAMLRHPDTEGPAGQQTLPTIAEPEPADALTKKMRADLEGIIKPAFDEEYEDRLGKIEAPHYLEEQARESTRESWDNMDDDDKFSWAKHNGHVEQADSGKTKETWKQMEMPHTFRPVSANSSLMSEVEDYRKTSGVAHYLSQERAYELVQERLNDPSISRNDVTAADRRIWNSWVDSSSTNTAVQFQAAAAEELGGRFRPVQEGGNNLKDIEAIKKAANSNFEGIGGWEGLKAYSRAKWETTQYLLDKADIPHLQLYRGIMLDDATVKDLPVEEVETKPIEIGGGYTSTTAYKRLPTLSIVRNGAASTSASAQVANSWNGIGVSHDFPRRVILRAEVPRTAAISVPSYGQNLQKEQEVVVLGTAWKKWDAWKDNAPEFDKIAIAKRIAGVTQRGPELTIDLLAYEAGNNLPNWLSPKGRGVAKGNPNHLGPGPGGGQFSSGPGGGTEASALFEAHHDPNVTAENILDRAPAGVRERVNQVETLLAHTKPTDGQLGDGGFKRQDGTWDDERAAVHERILRGLFNPEAVRNATPAPGEKPTAIFLGGRGGSGKRWFTGRNGPVDPSKAIYINSDDLQAELPGYHGWNAAHYHEEASDILTQAEGIGRRQGLNMIFDSTMRSGATTAQRVAQLQAAGYDIKGYYMFTSPQEAAQRAVSRFASQGRYVRPSYILGSTTNERTFDNLKPSFSDWAIYDNNTPGGSPKLVARKTP